LFGYTNVIPQITLLKTLILWSLHSSEVISGMLKDQYKSRTSKEKNDVNIPLSVQPWGEDGDKRKYYLIEGQDDTSFRVYRESDLTARKEPRKENTTWYSSAGSIDELRVLAQKLADDDGTRKGKALSERILNAIPRFEATEEVRCAFPLLQSALVYPITQSNFLVRTRVSIQLFKVVSYLAHILSHHMLAKLALWMNCC
jgi:hypothetical protein